MIAVARATPGGKKGFRPGRIHGRPDDNGCPIGKDEGVEHAVTVRVRDGKMSSTDGPFMETKEVLGGFLLVEARDLNDAVRVASGIPFAKLGSIEVRPVVDFSKPRPEL